MRLTLEAKRDLICIQDSGEQTSRITINRTKQGAKKVSFTVCHSGKLKLAFTSPNTILTSPQKFFEEQK